jgi:intein/homing endonuclease
VIDRLLVSHQIGIIGYLDFLQDITGRRAPEKLMRIADLVSEVKEIKHYFKRGVKARTGIEQ